ncbi:MAG: tRNA pseudouridine(38-40) synthase TruA [Mangrovibacterium sp.]
MEKLSCRYFMELAYKGTSYCGWQVQPEERTVQGDLENALSTICREKIAVVGCGRTDAGVHASYYVAHFNSAKEGLDAPDFTHKLNSFLSKDIALFSIRKVNNDTHARFDACQRTYHYHINIKKNPFTQESSWYYNRKLDVQLMNKACDILFEYEDFTSFSKLHTDVKTNNCTIYQAFWEEKNNSLKFTISANRFLRNMVRAIVGTLVEVGEGKLSPDDFRAVIEAKDRGRAGKSVPPQALFLADIAYPKEVFEH